MVTKCHRNGLSHSSSPICSSNNNFEAVKESKLHLSLLICFTSNIRWAVGLWSSSPCSFSEHFPRFYLSEPRLWPVKAIAELGVINTTDVLCHYPLLDWLENGNLPLMNAESAFLSQFSHVRFPHLQLTHQATAANNWSGWLAVPIRTVRCNNTVTLKETNFFKFWSMFSPYFDNGYCECGDYQIIITGIIMKLGYIHNSRGRANEGVAGSEDDFWIGGAWRTAWTRAFVMPLPTACFQAYQPCKTWEAYLLMPQLIAKL